MNRIANLPMEDGRNFVRLKRVPNVDDVTMYKYIQKKFGALVSYYARNYTEVLRDPLALEDIQAGITYEMMKVFHNYTLKGKPLSEIDKLLKTIPVYYWRTHLKRARHQRNNHIHINTIQIEDTEKFECLYDIAYDRFIAAVPENSDEKELLLHILYKTDVLKDFAKKGKLSKDLLIRFFQKEYHWTRPKFAKVWDKAQVLLHKVLKEAA